MKGTILIVEDEKKLANIMSLYLEKEGYSVSCAYDGISAENLIDNNKYDLVILDVMMPFKDGWSILRKIKGKDSTPVILTTARGEEDDRIFGFELGADDYMVKPLSMKELILRVKLRIKTTYKQDNLTINLEELAINEEKREASENKIVIPLTPKEFDLLLFFLKNSNQVFKREQLLDNVWGYEFFGDTRTVDTHVKKLREKINFCEKYLKTVWGVGYKMEI